MPHPAIAALDNAIAQSGRGEWITLRRVVGEQPNVVNVDVQCFVQVDAASLEQIALGIAETDLNIIMSTTQIDEAQWPGGSPPVAAPFNPDPRIPRINEDKVIARGRMCTVAFVDPKGNPPLRINMRVTG